MSGAKQVAHLDLTAALVMGAATLATAWCGFQAAIWSGIQTFDLASAQSAARAAAAAEVEARQQGDLDLGLFQAYIAAKMRHEEELARFYRERFNPTLAEAVTAWFATDPEHNPKAPLHPFAMPQYHVKAWDVGRAEREKSATLLEKAETANGTADRYVLATVLLASCLLFSGTAAHTRTQKVGQGMVVFAGLILLLVIAFLVRMPVSFE